MGRRGGGGGGRRIGRENSELVGFEHTAVGGGVGMGRCCVVTLVGW